MSDKTSFDELYNALITLVNQATGRNVWRKSGIQAQPQGAYATVYIAAANGFQHEYVENVELNPIPITGERFQQIPWGTASLDVQVEFYRKSDIIPDTAMMAANRLRSALRMQERYYDLYTICALSGSINILDIAAVFRSDTEQRARVSFSLLANIAYELPLSGDKIFDINNVTIDLVEVRQGDNPDGSESPVETIELSKDDES